MDELLLGIEKELQERITSIRRADVYITPSLVFIPQGVGMPCLGIKDGKVTHRYLAGGAKEYTMIVRLVLFMKPTAKEAAIVGSDKSGKKGILNLQREVVGILENNLLKIDELEEAIIIDDPEVQFYPTDKRDYYLRKELGLQYTKTVEKEE